MRKDILYIVIPAYNEEANIEKVVNDWYRNLEIAAPESRLVVADSRSTDNTHNILTKMQEDHPQLVVLSSTLKFHGPKVYALYQYAIQRNADYIFQTDSDGQTNADEFVDFWNKRADYDIILGNRKERRDGKSRAFVEKVVCLMLRIYFHVNAPDANAPFRLMKTSVVKKYLPNIPDDYNLPNIILTAYFLHNREKCLFIPVSFKPRQGGKNSINIKKIMKIGWKSLTEFSQFQKTMQG